MEIRFLRSMDVALFHEAFLRAFSDYVVPMRLTREQFDDLITRRGVDPSISIGAFEKGVLIGFNLNAIDTYDGTLTIYDSGTGTVPEYRRRGIAEVLFRQSLPYLKDLGASQYILEVFQQNASAVRLYEKVGFRVVRRLESFQRKDSVSHRPLSNSLFDIQEIEPDWPALQRIWDWNPTWQNSIASIQRSKAARVILGVFRNKEFAGYGIVFPGSGDIPQFCIRRVDRRKGAATTLLSHLQSCAPNAKLRMINMDSIDQATLHFLKSQGFGHLGTQLEMKMDLLPDSPL